MGLDDGFAWLCGNCELAFTGGLQREHGSLKQVKYNGERGWALSGALSARAYDLLVL